MTKIPLFKYLFLNNTPHCLLYSQDCHFISFFFLSYSFFFLFCDDFLLSLFSPPKVFLKCKMAQIKCGVNREWWINLALCLHSGLCISTLRKILIWSSRIQLLNLPVGRVCGGMSTWLEVTWDGRWAMEILSILLADFRFILQMLKEAWFVWMICLTREDRCLG